MLYRIPNSPIEDVLHECSTSGKRRPFMRFALIEFLHTTGSHLTFSKEQRHSIPTMCECQEKMEKTEKASSTRLLSQPLARQFVEVILHKGVTFRLQANADGFAMLAVNACVTLFVNEERQGFLLAEE